MDSPPITCPVKPDSQAPILQPPSIKIREEGELSSSSEYEEFSLCSKERLPGVSNPAGAAPDKGALVNTNPVKSVSPISNVDAINIQAQSSLQSESRISIENIPVPLRSSTTKWNGKSGPNDDLVIVFSDDESGSDSQCKQKKTNEVKGVMSSFENRKPAPSSYRKVGSSQKAEGDGAKLQLNRGLFSRTFTFTPSHTKPYGPKPNVAAKPKLRPGFVIKNHNAVDQKTVNCKPKQGACLDINELQDLRQKIAIRESELKLKSSRKIRETMAGSSQMYDSSYSRINIPKRERSREMPSDYVHPEVTEPDKKRMKNVSSGRTKQSATVELVEQGGPDSNPSGGQSEISCKQKRQALPNQHTENVLGVIDCPKELDSLGNEFSQGYDLNSSGLRNHSLRSLFAMEEMHDKEIEEAQKDRRHCEIEERLAHKMYLEAQSALIEATGRCDSLYRQREQSSTQFLSLLIGEGNVHVHSRFATRMDQVDKTTRGDVVGNRSLQVLLELDDSHEKELEEAQEYRHKCEIDERHFLKAYRRTQLALIEASDRCSYLYRQRQQSVTRANIEFYSRCYNQFESSTDNNLNTQSRVDLDVIQPSQYARQAHTDTTQVGYDSNFRNTLIDPATVSYQYMVGSNIGSETCSEPDSSSSEPLPHPDSNADYLLCSSNSNPAIFVDHDEQTLSSSDRPCPPESRCVKQCPSVETKNSPDDDTQRTFPADCDQVFLLQEAKLRSELRARLGQRPFSQKLSSDIQSNQHFVKRAAENDINSEKSELYTSKSPSPQEEKTQLFSHGVDPDQDWDSQLSFRSAACYPDPVLRSTFSYIKNLNSAVCKSVMLQAKHLEYRSHNISNFKGSDNSSEKTQFCTLGDNKVLSVKDIFSKQYESYSCNLEADPFWPLCMYELRGKCNDEQCCWQHIKAHLNQKTNLLSSLDTACSIRPQFPTSIAASRLLQRKVLSAELSGHVGNQRFQANESNRKLSYLQSRGTFARLENNIPDVESSLETALVILDQEIDKFEGTNEALLLLSRAIEVDPKSSAIWIIYLLVYYSNKRSDEKDNMFLYAVENNTRSYELWLLYINSRMEFSSRLAAYDKALSALCSESSVPQAESDTGSLILDIFLQMLDFLCMSGQVEKAIAKVLELIHAASTSDESLPLLSGFYSLLTVPDKCILWVCCVYLGVYRRLPEAVVHQFELKKELLEIDWPDVELLDDMMQSSKKLMIAVEQIVDLCIDAVSLDNLTDLKALQFFAVNHFRCKVRLEGFNSGTLLAKKYIKLYPACWELVLLMARIYSSDFQESSVSGFEEALRNCPKEVLGAHCIWNQYTAHALEKQRFDIASEVICRWYESAYKCQAIKCHDEDSVHQIQDAPSDYLSREDNMFRCLNLAVYHELRSEHQEALLAVNKALEIAPPDLFKHCVREHASFHLNDVQPKDDTSVSSIVELLNSYMVDPRASIASCALSRKFISNIKKPRVQQLAKKFLADISPDCAILNSALEAWCGPSLLPQNCIETKQLVNFVEAIMEITPTNHRFASHVFRHVSKDFNSKDVSTSSLLFWASNLVVSSIFEAVPVAPEYVWVEAAALLVSSTSIQDISEKFHERAVTVYPFSIKLWKSYLNHLRVEYNSKSIIERAREKGLQLELPQQIVD